MTSTVEVPVDLPLVWGASNQLEQVFLNVLVNAWHAMPQAGTVTIRAEVCDDHYVRVSCRDTGMGMSAEVLTRTFEPFFTTKAGKGTGLGLAICRQIVDGHQGSIALDSLPGKGTTVTIVLLQADTLP
jgi:signal transduction histidine kinase